MEKAHVKGAMELLVLRALKNQELHGYAILQKLRLAGDGHFAASEGNLYPLLTKLEQAKLLTSVWEERRKYYRLTASGHRRLKAASQQWMEFSQRLSTFLGSEPEGASC